MFCNKLTDILLNLMFFVLKPDDLIFLKYFENLQMIVISLKTLNPLMA